MSQFNLKEKGVALLVVLATILVVVILANIALNFMVSQSRLGTHKVNRLQAYYAGLAATNYAHEMLRSGTWDPTSCLAGCAFPNDANFPASVQQPLNIVFTPAGGACGAPAGSICVSVQVQYLDPIP
jgi:Tfp pilus assembly protein PilX